MAIILGMREKKRIKFKVNDTQNSVNSDNNKSITGTYTLVDENVDKPKLLWFNALLTLGLIATLMSGIIPAALIFMIAVSIALTVNFPNVKSQFERIKAHSPSALLMASIILAAGVFLGILTGTKMLDALAVSLTTLLPTVIIPYLHIIIGFFGVPFELILNTDAYYFALLPVVEQVVHVHGVSAQSTAYAMLIGNIVGTFISPFSPALWLALGLAGLEMGKHIMYSFFWLWGFSIVILILAMLMGVI
jgi:CitMHS family citrate-Mg2+:H+ or citrate-Ca2+:H+ symporter